jgi:hypothetical protein
VEVVPDFFKDIVGDIVGRITGNDICRKLRSSRGRGRY